MQWLQLATGRELNTGTKVQLATGTVVENTGTKVQWLQLATGTVVENTGTKVQWLQLATGAVVEN